MQHGLLKLLDPPYVYNVQKGDQEGFVKAIQDAISNPIDRFVPVLCKVDEYFDLTTHS